MDNLEKYISTNPEQFDIAELPEGHLERFEKRLDAAFAEAAAQPHAASQTASVRRPVWASTARISAIVAAAAVIAIFIISPARLGGRHWFSGTGNDPQRICAAYFDKVSSMYDDIYKAHPDGSLETAAASVAEEAVPLVDLLPDELSEKEKAAILKEYYGNLLDGLNEIRKVK